MINFILFFISSQNISTMKVSHTRSKKKRQRLYNDNILKKDEIIFESYAPPPKQINYNSFFFRSDIVDDFTTELNDTYRMNDKQSPLMTEYKLYNIDEIISTILVKSGPQTRSYQSQIQSSEWRSIRKYIISLIPISLANVCYSNVNKSYVRGVINNQILPLINSNKNEYSHDLIMIAPRTIENYITYTTVLSNTNTTTTTPTTKKRKRSISSDSSDSTNADSESDEEYSIESSHDDSDSESDDYSRMTRMEDKIFSKMKKELKFAKYEKQLKLKLKMISGFMIVSRGQCKLFPNDYVLNLICSNVQGLGSMLLGLYLYTILRHPIILISKTNLSKKNMTLKKSKHKQLTERATIQYNKSRHSKTFKKKYKSESTFGISMFQKKFITSDELIPTNGYALLELAGGYFNYSGICSYQKFGFEYNKSMFSKSQCIYDPENMPMSIYFGSNATTGCYANLSMPEKINKIFQIIVGNQQCPRDNICRVKNTQYQKLLSHLKSIIMYQDAMNQFNQTSSPKYIMMYNDDFDDNMNNILDTANLMKRDDETTYHFIKTVIENIESEMEDPSIEVLLNNLIGGKHKIKMNKNRIKK
jgi:hypothetical protein